jgi:hypothetical protein
MREAGILPRASKLTGGKRNFTPLSVVREIEAAWARKARFAGLLEAKEDETEAGHVATDGLHRKVAT